MHTLRRSFSNRAVPRDDSSRFTGNRKRRARPWIWLVIALWGAWCPPVSGQNQRLPTLVNELNMTFVLIPAGTFIMGSPESEPLRGDSEAAHPVTISRPFYMQTTEVTVDQWRAIMGRRLYERKKCIGNMPAARVSWHDCMKFIRKLNRKTDKRHQLPTEAQWEYAARAGTTTAYFWGDRIDCSRALYANNPKKHDTCILYNRTTGIVPGAPVPVMQYRPNSWGLYDMHGNVWEWCRDLFAPYDRVAAVDPCHETSGIYRVRRGGSWFGAEDACRSANRAYGHPMSRLKNTGFRLVLELPEEKVRRSRRP